MPPKKKPLRAAQKSKPVWWPWAAVALVALALSLWWWHDRKPAHTTGTAGPPPLPGVPPFQIEPDAKTFAAYAGPQSCRDCHPQAFDLWKNSHHALAERKPDDGLDRPFFDPPRQIKHGTQTSESRAANARFEVVTAGTNGASHPFPVERVIGVDPLRQFLVAAPGGRWQVTELAADPARVEWFDVYGAEDRQPGEWGHWTGRGMNWNNMCATCHNTRLRKNYQETTDTYATTMAAMGVGCEACHGPMADHVAWQNKYPQPAKGDPTLRRFSRDQTLATCGACHARRSELTGDFRPGDLFLDHHSPVIPDESDVFYPDGQVRDEDYEFTSFLSSRMHNAGIRCFDCHEPHSSKTRAAGNALCLMCHTGQMPNSPKIDPGPHSHHAPDQPGGRCVDCHMPQTTYMQRHARRDHGFTIPDPLLTKQHSIPNACNRCHTDRDTDWALAAVEKWYGARMDRPTRTRAQWIAQARAGERSAYVNLLRLLTEEKIPLWRAAAIHLLKRWCFEPAVTAALLRSAGDADPLVRGTAAQALGLLVEQGQPAVQTTLHNLLNDPVRKVRMDAAWSLRATLDPRLPAGQDLLRTMHQNADQPAGALQLGEYHLDRHENETALGYFRRAVSWDPLSGAVHHELALALSQTGHAPEAVQELEAACRLSPRESEYRFKLGLAYNEVGRVDQTAAALEEAVRLDPQFAQAWYNLGLAYSTLKQPDRALEALVRAESINPASPQYPYARATILARLGRVAEARTAARRALAIQPAFSDAASLLQTLEQQAR